MSDSRPAMDPVLLEVLWNRLISIVNEQAAALMHASFTTVVREAGDLSAGIFDRGGNMLAQAVTGTPGHINTMATGVRHFVRAHPIDSLEPGDSLLTNDPWMVSGHLHDITVVTPVFHGGRGIGWFANTCHAMDIGGRTLGADAREVFEEGLAIPIMKLFRQGIINDDLVRIVRANVREPDAVVGDLYAQQAGNDVGAAKLADMMEEYGLADVEDLGEQIRGRSEQATGDAIEAVGDGTWEDEVEIDGFDEPLVIRIALTVEGRRLLVDYAGTSPQVDRGINVVYNYTHAYTTYPLACAISPHVPNNEGSFRPVTVTAPEGSILNARRPCAVGARHLIGHFLSQAVFGALSQVVPGRVLADGSAGLWNTQLEGRGPDGRLFAYIFFSAGGMGARPTADGLSATAFPSGIRGVPAEAIESVSPTLMLKRALRPDSGGAAGAVVHRRRRTLPRRPRAGDGPRRGQRPPRPALADVRPHPLRRPRFRRRPGRRRGPDGALRRHGPAPEAEVPAPARPAGDPAAAGRRRLRPAPRAGPPGRPGGRAPGPGLGGSGPAGVRRRRGRGGVDRGRGGDPPAARVRPRLSAGARAPAASAD